MDSDDRCSTYRLEAGQSFGFKVEWANHPRNSADSSWRCAKIVEINNTKCVFSDQLKVGDFIVDVNGDQITNLKTFRGRVKNDTQFRVLEDEVQPPPQPHPAPNAVVTEKPSDTTRKRQREEQQDNEDASTENSHPDSSPVMPNALYKTPPQNQDEEFTTPAGNVQKSVAAGKPPSLQRDRNILLHPSCRCEGITKEVLMGYYKCDDIEDVLDGFDKVAANAQRCRLSFQSQKIPYPFPDTTVGVLLKDNILHREDDFDYTWEVLEMKRGAFSFHRKTCRKNQSMVEEDDVELKDGTNTCSECFHYRASLVRLCRTESNLHKEKDKGNIALVNYTHTDIQYKSPSLVTQLIKNKSQKTKVLQKKITRQEKWRKELEKDNMDFPNVKAELLFDKNELQKCYDKLLEKGEIKGDDIDDFLFNESILVGKRKKLSGTAQGHVYSPLFLQYAIMLRSKCSASTYEVFQRVFNLPSNRTLCRYSKADSTSPDGLMMESIIQTATIFNQQGVDRNHWSRRVNLGWDSHVIKDHLMFDPHTKRLVGYSDDAFDIDVIRKECERRFGLTTAANSDSNTETADTNMAEIGDEEVADGGTDEDDKETDQEIPLGKHFMVFMCQTFAPDGGPSRFMVARYCLGGLTAPSIAPSLSRQRH